MTPDDALETFRRFLDASWPQVEIVIGSIMDPESWLGDWCQANWELLVEAQLCSTPREILEIYGDGADCNSPSSRVWLPAAKATHVVRCQARGRTSLEDLIKQEEIPLDKCVFHKFVRFVNGKHGDGSPFDHVLLEADGEVYLTDKDSIEFKIALI